jgi:hypothetical protein
MGKMPSSGPHPDSNLLLADEKPMQVSSLGLADVEEGFPQHRHMVVFSFRVLKKYLRMAGFSEVRAYGFGLYPFPNFMQPLLEKLDPFHCHQIVMVATNKVNPECSPNRLAAPGEDLTARSSGME